MRRRRARKKGIKEGGGFGNERVVEGHEEEEENMKEGTKETEEKLFLPEAFVFIFRFKPKTGGLTV